MSQSVSYRIDESDRLLSPSLIIFKELLEQNLRMMIEIAGDAARLRPHCKTHKMSALIGVERELGIEKHKCATIAEAEMLARAGIEDVLLAYNLVGPNLDRMRRLCCEYPAVQFKATVDHPTALRQAASHFAGTGRELGLVLDLNPGMNRTGIRLNSEGIEQAESLYLEIDRLAGVYPAGFQLYDGHHRQVDRVERAQAVDSIWQRALQLRDRLIGRGVEVPLVVAGGSGSFPCFAQFDEPWLELSPGTVVFYDAGYQENFPDLSFVPAALILTRVISKPAPGMLTLDLGHKACAADPPAGKRLLFPQLADAVESQQSEEHLVLSTESADQFDPGDELLAIPWHICPTSAVHQQAYVIENGKHQETWKVDARDRVLTI